VLQSEFARMFCKGWLIFERLYAKILKLLTPRNVSSIRR
jgi:hypothetical protein